MTTDPNREPIVRAGGVRAAMIAARALVLLWAGFWTWFIVSVVVGEARSGAFSGVGYGGAILAVIFAASAVACLRPRIGGALLALVGAAGAVVFRDASAWWLLAGPAVVLGALLAALDAWRADSHAGLIPR